MKTTCIKGQLLSLISLFFISAIQAAEFKEGNIFYRTLSDDEVAVIAPTDYSFTYSGSIVLPESITHEGTEYRVTTIAQQAFFMAEITSITIPNSVTEIQQYAFAACRELSSITLPEGLSKITYRAFSQCINLTEIALPESVTEIEDFAFRDCTGLTAIALGNQVTRIGNNAFYNCTTLQQFTVVEGNPVYASVDGILFDKAKTTLLAYPNAKGATYAIPDEVIAIGPGAFQGCSGLTSITLGKGIASLGSNPFASCSSLQEILVDAANAHYTSVDGVLFDKSQEILIQYPLSRSGFYEIPLGVTTIGDYAFCNCTKLSNITIPESVTTRGEWAFAGCAKLSTATLPDAVTSVGNSAFKQCSNLCRVTFGANLQTIGNTAFSSTPILSLTIPDQVTSIGEHAFSYCPYLTDIVLGRSLQEIGQSAFAWSQSIRQIKCCSFYPPVCGVNCFDGVSVDRCFLTVPSNAYDYYKADPTWSRFDLQGSGAPTAIDQPEANPVSIHATGHSIVISNLPADTDVTIYNLAGQMVQSIRPTTQNVEIELPAGILYIVRTGDRTQKVKL